MPVRRHSRTLPAPNRSASCGPPAYEKSTYIFVDHVIRKHGISKAVPLTHFLLQARRRELEDGHKIKGPVEIVHLSWEIQCHTFQITGCGSADFSCGWSNSGGGWSSHLRCPLKRLRPYKVLKFPLQPPQFTTCWKKKFSVRDHLIFTG
jgi:hypothetical protein